MCVVLVLDCSSRDRFSAEFSYTSPGKFPTVRGMAGQGYVWQWPCEDKPAMGGFLRCSAEALLCFSGPQAKNNDSPPCCRDHFKVSLPREASTTSPVSLVGKLLGGVYMEGDADIGRCLGGTSASAYSASVRLREVPRSSSYVWPLQCSWRRGTLTEQSEQDTGVFSLRCYKDTSQAGEIWLEISLGERLPGRRKLWGLSVSVASRAMFSFLWVR